MAYFMWIAVVALDFDSRNSIASIQYIQYRAIGSAENSSRLTDREACQTHNFQPSHEFELFQSKTASRYRS